MEHFFNLLNYHQEEDACTGGTCTNNCGGGCTGTCRDGCNTTSKTTVYIHV